LAGCLILTVLAACDNVSWGGADLTIVPPPPKAGGPPEPGKEPGVDPLPQGPILYHVEATAQNGRLTPVAAVVGDSLEPIRPRGNVRAFGDALIAAQLQPGTEFVLFRDGLRAGTFITQSASLVEMTCGPTPQATGELELAATAAGAREFLALAKVQAPQVARRPVESFEPNRTMRVLAPILADNLLRSRNAPLPTNWERALAQLRPFATGASQDLAFTATYLVGDTLGPGLDDVGQSLFFIGLPQNMGYDTVFVRYHDYAAGGKAALRVIDGIDLNNDEMPEFVLRVFGASDAWYEAIGRGRDGRWRVLMSDRCSAPAAVPGEPEAGIP
jgi:hypothetical protein